MMTADIDLAGLNGFLQGLATVLHGTGQAGEGDLQRLMKTEAGQMAWDYSEALGPKTKADATDSIEKSINEQMSDKPRYSNLDQDQQYSSTNEFTWLAAGPNFLVGINNEDNRTDLSPGAAYDLFRQAQKAGARGNAWLEVGQRGHQHVLRLNRIRITAAAKKSILRFIRDNLVGELRASFASTAEKLLPGKRIPDWVRDKIFQVDQKGKSIFNLSALNNATNPYIEFGSHAKGVQSNPIIVEKLAAATESRKYKIAEKIKKILAGHAYDWNTGRVFRPQARDLEEAA